MDNDRSPIQQDLQNISDTIIADSKPFNPIGIAESKPKIQFIFGFGGTIGSRIVTTCFIDTTYTSQDFTSTLIGQKIFILNNYPQADTSNDIIEMKKGLTEIIQTYYETFLEEEESNFNCELQAWFEKYGILAIGYTLELYKSGELTNKLMSTMLKIIGRLNDAETYNERLLMLSYYLFDSTPIIRFGSIIGLSNFRDNSLLETLNSAVTKERIPMNKGLLNSLINKLT